MEISSQSTYHKSSFIKHNDILDIAGFIVNIHDPINYDIDLDIPEFCQKKCKNVIYNDYTYKDLTDEWMNNPKIDDLNRIPTKNRKAYRCRLRGIGISNPGTYFNPQLNEILIKIKNFIDLADGWVVCNLSDTDIYHRLLVDITINTPSCKIDLCDFILNNMSKYKYPIYYPYYSRYKPSYNF